MATDGVDGFLLKEADRAIQIKITFIRHFGERPTSNGFSMPDDILCTLCVEVLVPFRFVPEGDGKPVPRINTHHSEIEIDELLFGEDAGGFRVDIIGQMLLRD